MVLDAEDRLVLDRDAAVGAVEQADVGFDHGVGQAVAVHGEAVVHRHDLDLAGRQILDRMVGAVVALLHLDRLGAERDGQHLVTQADAHQRLAAGDQLLDLGHSVFAGRGRITRTVRQDHAVGIAGQDVLGRGGGRNHGDLGARRGQGAQDVALHAIVHDHDILVGRFHARIAGGPFPHALVPVEGLQGRGVLGQVQADQAGPGLGLGHQGLQVELAVRVVGDDGVGRALVTDDLGQGAGVHARQADHAAALHPGVQISTRAPVGRIGGDVAEDGAARRGARAVADLLHVLDVDADIADVGEGEGQDLAHVGGVGQDFLIARHGGVEDHLAEGRADGADADTLQDGAVSEREDASGAGQNLGRHGAGS
ncbi:hypothetical protein D3C80_908100 [compost metagenome]